ncbi:caspase family protein [Leisingera daeponensis]|uniref:Caspase family protein n=1 Tax=Leisingera daeponensis TaxID=405746 RepID=A0ABS7N9J5_9RHOB|nr:caspase family protein [Leisingera daeponensis]MBY6137869.1 caspase family protein [Leisingera daeponensis]
MLHRFWLIRAAAAGAVLVLVTLAGAAARAGERIALVVGNSNYAHTAPLANPGNDARVMAGALEGAGFEVTTLLDADLGGMKQALLRFGRRLRGDGVEAGLFYYAGHGVQVDGENYLVPVSAAITSEDEIDLEAVNVNSFLRVMNSSNASINIVILDACRNNPFAASARSAARGLAPVDAPRGTLIAYATAPGDVALDGSGANSPYTKALAGAISAGGGRTIEAVFKAARSEVLAATQERQVPWETSSITGDFYFHTRPAAAQTGSAPAALPADSISQKYRLAERINTRAAWQAFVEAHREQPENFYVILALEALAGLDAPVPQPQRHLPLPATPAYSCHRGRFGTVGGELCVSSHLAPQGRNAYSGAMLSDGSASTAWVEGRADDGEGEVLRFAFPGPQQVSRVLIANGYGKSRDIFLKNSRVRSMTVQTSAGFRGEVELQDRDGLQELSLPPLGQVTWITFTLTGVYHGTRYRDTAISEIQFR